jgi:hypothetical protein
VFFVPITGQRNLHIAVSEKSANSQNGTRTNFSAESNIHRSLPTLRRRVVPAEINSHRVKAKQKKSFHCCFTADAPDATPRDNVTEKRVSWSFSGNLSRTGARKKFTGCKSCTGRSKRNSPTENYEIVTSDVQSCFAGYVLKKEMCQV